MTVADVELRSADQLDAAGLAALFTAGYEGYQFPIELDAAAFTAMAEASDFDLRRSLVAFRGDRPIGFVVLGVRGTAGWIGGLGVVSDERRHGVGRALMQAVLDSAVAAGLREVSLEVLEPNTGALALYEQLDFRATRMLELWTLDAEVGTSAAVESNVDEAHGWIRRHRVQAEPWQRADASLDGNTRDDLRAVVLGPRCSPRGRVLGRPPWLRIRRLPASLPRNDHRTPATSDIPPNPLGAQMLDLDAELGCEPFGDQRAVAGLRIAFDAEKC